jgi:Phosphoesterase family
MAVQAEHDSSTGTPIKHVVVIFGENISFDHYFGTYPNALNPRNEPRFVAAPGTPSVNGYTDALLFNNPNLLNKTGNAGGASNPFRLDRSQAATSDQDHDYTPEQQAFHGGLMDSFPQFTGTPGPPPNGQTTTGLTMGYYDGNTVTALWNYAQRFAMNDNSYNTTFLRAFDAGRHQSDLRPDQRYLGSVECRRRRDWGRPGRLHPYQRRRPDWRRVLDHNRCPGAVLGTEHWRSAEHARRDLGLL